MTKTKAVQKDPNKRRLETKGYKTGQDSEGSPKRRFSRPFLILFNFLTLKD